jgi:hypothetical protein
MPKLRSRIDLDQHTVTCIKCGLMQRSIDLSRTSMHLVVAYEDRFAVEHTCGKAKQQLSTHTLGDAWKDAWAAFERENSHAA